MMDAEPDTVVAINRVFADFHGCPTDQALPCLKALRHVVTAHLERVEADPGPKPHPVTPIFRTADAPTAKTGPDAHPTGRLVAIHERQPLHNGQGARPWTTTLMIATISLTRICLRTDQDVPRGACGDARR